MAVKPLGEKGRLLLRGPRIARGFSRLILILATRGVRVMLIGLFVLIAAGLLYRTVWRMVTQPIGLPPGVVDINPGLDGETLKKINQQRIERAQGVLPSFAAVAPVLGTGR